jgi:hypothetical protein
MHPPEAELPNDNVCLIGPGSNVSAAKNVFILTPKAIGFVVDRETL